MKLKDKLFVMKNNEPMLNAIGINIPQFTKLWNEDKSSNKSQYAKEVAYVYHMCDYESPYYDVKDKEKEISKAIMNKENYVPPKRVKDCIELYKKLEDTPEKRALDASLSNCDAISESLASYSHDATQMNNLMKEIDIEMQNCDTVYEKVQLLSSKNDIKQQVINLAKSAADLIPKLEKNIESIIKLREKLTKTIYDSTDSNRDSISSKLFVNEIIDDLKNLIDDYK